VMTIGPASGSNSRVRQPPRPLCAPESGRDGLAAASGLSVLASRIGSPSSTASSRARADVGARIACHNIHRWLPIALSGRIVAIRATSAKRRSSRGTRACEGNRSLRQTRAREHVAPQDGVPRGVDLDGTLERDRQDAPQREHARVASPYAIRPAARPKAIVLRPFMRVRARYLTTNACCGQLDALSRFQPPQWLC